VHATADSGAYESDARGILAGPAAADRGLELRRADHYFTEPVGAREELADLLAAWAGHRF
jgi:hypothetical protein